MKLFVHVAMPMMVAGYIATSAPKAAILAVGISFYAGVALARRIYIDSV